MTSRNLSQLVGLFVLASLMSVAVGVVLGQVGQPEAVTTEEAINSPPYEMNYQGFLTDEAGQPLEGDYQLGFSLYDSPTAENEIWGPEIHPDVPVKRGLFNVVLGQEIELAPVIFRRALYLQVTVNETATLSLQPLRAVPNAFSLLPGATIEGNPLGTIYALTAINTDTNPQSQGRGLWAQGYQYGVVAQETGPGNVSLKSTSFVEAQGYKSLEPTYWWSPGISGRPANSADLTMGLTITGTAELGSSITGTHEFYLPLALPTVLYGQPVRVTEMTLYYATSQSESYIAAARLDKQVSATTSETLMNRTLMLSSTTPTSYTHPLQNGTLTADSGPLTLQLRLTIADPSHLIYIGGVRLRLEHHEE